MKKNIENITNFHSMKIYRDYFYPNASKEKDKERNMDQEDFMCVIAQNSLNQIIQSLSKNKS